MALRLPTSMTNFTVQNLYSDLFTTQNETVTKNTSWNIAGVDVPVRISEDHENTATVTSIPVESGATLSDHIILQPITLNVSAEVNNAGTGNSKAKSVMEAFYSMIKKRQLQTVATEHTIYNNMALVSISSSHAAPFKGTLQISLKFQQVSLVGLQNIGQAPVTKKRYSSKKQAGEVQTRQPKSTGLAKAFSQIGG